MLKIAISKKYGETEVLKDFCLTAEDGQIVALLGESGSGKTTVLNAVSGSIPYDGAIEKSGEVSYIFQSPRLMPWATVYGNLDFVLTARIKDKTARRAAIESMLAATELTPYADQYPDRLSGGQQQRVAIARAFLYPADILLMDEPWRGLDIRLKGVLVKEFRRLFADNPRTVVFVTHDIDEAIMIADKIVVLDDGRNAAEYPVLPEQHDLSNGTAAELRKELFQQFLD